MRHGQTEYTYTYDCTVICNGGIQLHNFPLSEATWELVFDKSQPDGPDDPAEDVRAKRRRRRVDVPAAYGIFEGNQQSYGGRRNQMRLGQAKGADGQRGHARGRHSMPSRRERAASDDKEEHAPGPRQSRRRASLADVPVPREPARRGRKAAADSGGDKRARKSTRLQANSLEHATADDDDVLLDDQPDVSSHHTSASSAGRDEDVASDPGTPPSPPQTVSIPEESQPDTDADSEEDAAAASPPSNAPRQRGVKGRLRKRGAAAATRGRGRGGTRKRASAPEPGGTALRSATGAADRRRLSNKLKRRRETQSPIPEAIADAPGAAAVAEDAPRRGRKAQRRGQPGTADVAPPAAAAERAPKGDAKRAKMLTRLEGRSPAAPKNKATASHEEFARGVDASRSGDTGSGAGAAKRTRRRRATMQAPADGPHSSDAGGEGGGGTAAPQPCASGAGEVSAGVAVPAAEGAESGGADAGHKVPASPVGSDGQVPEARSGRRAFNASPKNAVAAAGSRGSRGRSHGKGAAGSEVTHSEVTKDSVGIGSRDGEQRRVAGLPMPVTNAPAQGEVGILSTRQISHADTVNTADFGPVDAMGGEGEIVWSFGASLGGEGGADVGLEAAAIGGPLHTDDAVAGSGGDQGPGAVADHEGGVSADAAALGSDERGADAVCGDPPPAAVREAALGAAERGTAAPSVALTIEAEAGVNNSCLTDFVFLHWLCGGLAWPIAPLPAPWRRPSLAYHRRTRQGVIHESRSHSCHDAPSDR